MKKIEEQREVCGRLLQKTSDDIKKEYRSHFHTEVGTEEVEEKHD